MPYHCAMEILNIYARVSAIKNLSDFARESGVSRSTLLRIKKGWKNPTYETLAKIEAELNRQEKRK